jgi:hypothetical protein
MYANLEEVEKLIGELKEKGEQVRECKSQKNKLQFELAQLEADLLRKAAFDPSLRNEQQRAAAFKIEQYRSERWKKLQEELIPEIQEQLVALSLEMRLLHYLIQTYVGPVEPLTVRE